MASLPCGRHCGACPWVSCLGGVIPSCIIMHGSGELAVSTAQHSRSQLQPGSSTTLIPCSGSVWHTSQQPTF